jgi:hypothetical protein
MAEHWLAGLGDVEKTIHNAAWLTKPMQMGTVVYDLSRDGFKAPDQPKD